MEKNTPVEVFDAFRNGVFATLATLYLVIATSFFKRPMVKAFTEQPTVKEVFFVMLPIAVFCAFLGLQVIGKVVKIGSYYFRIDIEKKGDDNED